MRPVFRHLAVTLSALALTAATVPFAVAAQERGLNDYKPVDFHGDLTKLRADVADPTDGAHAHLTSIQNRGSSIYWLDVWKLDKAAAGRTLAAHLHTGTCVAGDGAKAGPHYNIDAGAAKPLISQHTEVWLDITVNANGEGRAYTSVPFRITAPGSKALVIHEKATDHHDGMAGARIACLPVNFG